jgi:hypothetical protein
MLNRIAELESDISYHSMADENIDIVVRQSETSLSKIIPRIYDFLALADSLAVMASNKELFITAKKYFGDDINFKQFKSFLKFIKDKKSATYSIIRFVDHMIDVEARYEKVCILLAFNNNNINDPQLLNALQISHYSCAMAFDNDKTKLSILMLIIAGSLGAGIYSANYAGVSTSALNAMQKSINILSFQRDNAFKALTSSCPADGDQNAINLLLSYWYNIGDYDVCYYGIQHIGSPANIEGRLDSLRQVGCWAPFAYDYLNYNNDMFLIPDNDYVQHSCDHAYNTNPPYYFIGFIGFFLALAGLYKLIHEFNKNHTKNKPLQVTAAINSLQTAITQEGITIQAMARARRDQLLTEMEDQSPLEKHEIDNELDKCLSAFSNLGHLDHHVQIDPPIRDYAQAWHAHQTAAAARFPSQFGCVLFRPVKKSMVIELEEKAEVSNINNPAA